MTSSRRELPYNTAMHPIYLDYNATTPIDPAVLDAMRPYLRDALRQPVQHPRLRQDRARRRRAARGQVAALLGATPDEIVFTGGGTEAATRRSRGPSSPACPASSHAGSRRRTSSPAPSNIPPRCSRAHSSRSSAARSPCSAWIATAWSIPTRFDKAIGGNTTLVSIMHANNEVGTLQPIREIAQFAKERGVLVHTDAAQSLGKVPVDVNELGVDLLTVAGHKLYAPKGVGVLYVRKGVKLEPFIHGAGHEGGRRAGTENVPYIVALGKACEIAQQSLAGRDGAPQDVARSAVGPAASGARRPDRAQRPSRAAVAEHAQRQLRRPRRRRVVAEGAGDRGLDRVGVPRRNDHAIAGAVRDGGAAGDRQGGGAAERGPVHDRGRDRPGGGRDDSRRKVKAYKEISRKRHHLCRDFFRFTL